MFRPARFADSVNMNKAFEVNAPAVISEIIDGEAVMMNLSSGHYYSTEHSGAMIWGWIEKGRNRAELIALVERNFTALPVDYIAAIDAFVGELVAHELIREVSADGAVAPPAVSQANSLAAFENPVLNVYKDMKDLLLLDPIHDVDEAGWPMPKPENEP